MTSKDKMSVMNDDLSSNESLDLHDDIFDYSSEEDLEDYGNSVEAENLNKPKVKAVANIMNKILSRKEEGPILSKAVIESSDEEDSKSVIHKDEKSKSKIRNEIAQSYRIKPNTEQDYEKEKKLRIIGTQGVVQLFTTIATHNKQFKGLSLGNDSDKKKTKNGMNTFMSLLDKERKLKRIKNENEVKTELKTESEPKIQLKAGAEAGAEKPGWSVLAQNYYQEPDLKGWDQEDSD